MDPLKSLGTLNPGKKAASLVQEFKNFAFKGNVVDLAVGVIIGAAFGGIIKSLVDNIIMPLVSLLIPGGEEYKAWSWEIVSGKKMPFGLFLADVINFLIIAVALFLFISKFLGWLLKTKQEEAAAPPPLTKDQELLTQIRDLLQNRSAPGGSI
ncbi:MAG TPA: large conductance mechanosensitive channel protein MscL [Gemmataceae bacterium]|nr:large conductance mechanosensitive channel protein MscL [Gemmataceae bacterium]